MERISTSSSKNQTGTLTHTRRCLSSQEVQPAILKTIRSSKQWKRSTCRELRRRLTRRSQLTIRQWLQVRLRSSRSEGRLENRSSLLSSESTKIDSLTILGSCTKVKSLNSREADRTHPKRRRLYSQRKTCSGPALLRPTRASTASQRWATASIRDETLTYRNKSN